MAILSSTLAWKIPRTEEPGGLTVHGVAKSQTRLCKFTSLLGGRSYLYAAHGQVNTETPGQLEPEG